MAQVGPTSEMNLLTRAVENLGLEIDSTEFKGRMIDVEGVLALRQGVIDGTPVPRLTANEPGYDPNDEVIRPREIQDEALRDTDEYQLGRALIARRVLSRRENMSDIYEKLGVVSSRFGHVDPGENWPDISETFGREKADIHALGRLAGNAIFEPLVLLDNNSLDKALTKFAEAARPPIEDPDFQISGHAVLEGRERAGVRL